VTHDHSIGSERGKRGPKHRAPQHRQAAIELVSKGLATTAEIARLAGISRQLARTWVRDIDVSKQRQAHLRRLWSQAIAAQRMIKDKGKS